MTRAQHALCPHMPGPTTLRIRHRNRLRDVTFQIGPVTIPSSRKWRVAAELGADQKEQVLDHWQRMIKDPSFVRYFSRTKLPKELEPHWEWLRKLQRLRSVELKSAEQSVGKDTRALRIMEKVLAHQPWPGVKGPIDHIRIVPLEEGDHPEIKPADWWYPLTVRIHCARWIHRVWARGRIWWDPETFILDRLGDVALVQGPLLLGTKGRGDARHGDIRLEAL